MRSSVGSITSSFESGVSTFAFLFRDVLRFLEIDFRVCCFDPRETIFFVAVAFRILFVPVCLLLCVRAETIVAFFLRGADFFTAFFLEDATFFLATMFRLVVTFFLDGIEKCYIPQIYEYIPSEDSIQKLEVYDYNE